MISGRLIQIIHSKRLLTTDEGFSILEILVAVLVLSGFFLASLQATITASYIAVQAEDKEKATNWLQQDLELIRYQAFILDPGTPDATACSNSTYGNRLLNNISTGHPATQTISIDGLSYDVSRVYNPVGNILQVGYSLTYDDNQPHPRYRLGGNNLVSNLSTEVLPNASINCP